MKNEVTAKRLIMALDRINMKAQELADRAGLNKASISQYVNGTHAPSNLSAGKMAAVLGVSPVWLMGYDVPMFENSFIPDRPAAGADSSSTSFVQIPIYASVSAGPGCFAEGNIEGYTSIPEDMARNGDYFGLRVRGSSMDPEIKDQDVVVVRKTNVAESGDTVVAIVNGDSGFVKRLVKYAEGISLVSINATEYPPMIFTAKQVETLPVTIQGVVVRLIRDMGA